MFQSYVEQFARNIYTVRTLMNSRVNNNCYWASNIMLDFKTKGTCPKHGTFFILTEEKPPFTDDKMKRRLHGNCKIYITSKVGSWFIFINFWFLSQFSIRVKRFVTRDWIESLIRSLFTPSFWPSDNYIN